MKQINTKEYLTKAKAMIDTPEKWTTGTIARDANGVEIPHYEAGATCFCSLGALASVREGLLTAKEYSTENIWNVHSSATNSLRSVIGRSISTFNDNSTHEQVMKAFDDAIARA